MAEHRSTAITSDRGPAELAYHAWRCAETESERLLHIWFAAASPNRGQAYVAYRASIDREEAAANALVPFW
jgi:hypothetical protein